MSYKINNIVDVNILTDTLYRGAINFRAPPVIVIPVIFPPLDWGAISGGLVAQSIAINGDTLIVGLSNNMLRISNNGGLTFNADQTANVGRNDIPIAVICATDSVIIAGSWFKNSSRSVDGGVSFSPVLAFAVTANCESIIHVGGSVFIMGGTGGYISKTINDAALWSSLEKGAGSGSLTDIVDSIAKNSTIILFALRNGYLSSSTISSAGDSFSPLARWAGGSVGSVPVTTTVGDNIILMYSQQTYFKHTTNGVDWFEVTLPWPAFAVSGDSNGNLVVTESGTGGRSILYQNSDFTSYTSLPNDLNNGNPSASIITNVVNNGDGKWFANDGQYNSISPPLI